MAQKPRCEDIGKKCRLDKRTEVGVRHRTRANRWFFFCKECGHRGSSAFEVCALCNQWMNVNKMPDHHRRCKGNPRATSVSPPPRSVDPPRVSKEEEAVLSLVDDTNDEDTCANSSLGTDPTTRQVPEMVTESTVQVFDSIDLDDMAMDDGSTLAAEFEEWNESKDQLYPHEVAAATPSEDDKFDAPMQAEMDSKMWMELSEILADDEKPSLVRDRYYWNDLGVRLDIRLPLLPEEEEGINTDQWLSTLRPRHDYIKIALPRVDWIVHDFYHASLQQIHQVSDTELILEFIPFNPKDVFFEHLADLPDPEITGSAHFVLSSSIRMLPNKCLDRLASKMDITFYRHPEATDRDRMVLAIHDMMRRMDMHSLPDIHGSTTSTGASTSNNGRKRGRTEYQGNNQNFMWLGVRLRYERALIKLVRKFVATSNPPSSTLLQLEAMAKECGCFYVLHVLVDARLGTIVRNLFAERGSCDQLAQHVLDFLGCDFFAARAWAIRRIQTAFRDRTKCISVRALPIAQLFQSTSSVYSTTGEDDEHEVLYDQHAAENNTLRTRRRTEPPASLAVTLAKLRLDSDITDTDTIQEDEEKLSPPTSENEFSSSTVPRPRQSTERRRRLSAPGNPFQLRERFRSEAEKAAEDAALVMYRQRSSRDSFSVQQPLASLYETTGKYDAEAERCARKWIEKVTNRDIHKRFFDELRDGTLLCLLANKIKLNALNENELSEPIDRLVAFLSLLQDEFRIAPQHLFQPSDLLDNDEKDESKNAVVRCIFALADRTQQLRSDLPVLEHITMNNSVLPVVVDDDHDQDKSDLQNITTTDDQQQQELVEEDKARPHTKKRSSITSLLGKAIPSLSPGQRRSQKKHETHEAHRFKLQSNGISVIQYPADNKPRHNSAFLTVWTTTNHRDPSKEKNLCKLLQSKQKSFEVIYIDITPERKHALDTIAGSKKNVHYPVLTAGPELLGHFDEILNLDNNNKLDELISFATAGEGFWLMPKSDDWHTTSHHHHRHHEHSPHSGHRRPAHAT